MPTYRIELASTGRELITLTAACEADALEAMARFAGFRDFAHAVREEFMYSEFHVTGVTPPDPAVLRKRHGPSAACFES